ncbi:MAG: hypothetical protein U0529_02370 [Thermoanaerobaculia bacterium]
MALRTLHVVAMALVLGGVAFGIREERLRVPMAWTILSGVLLLAIEVARSGVFLYTGAGVASIVKLLLVGLGYHQPAARLAFYLAATVVASVGSHMTGSWRHWSFLDRKVLTQD